MADALRKRAQDIDDGPYRSPLLPEDPATNQLVSGALRGLSLHLDLTLLESAPFITCFCGSGDLLSQWRGYAAGGYAIGFDRDKLNHCEVRTPAVHDSLGGVPSHNEQQTSTSYPQLRPVVYDGPRKDDVIDGLTESVTDGVINHGPPATGVHEAHFLLFNVRPHIAYMKDPAFGEEREWRLTADGGKTLHRSTRIGPVPYVDVEFPVDAVRKIVVGPGPDRDMRLQAIAAYSRELSSGRTGIDVEPSRVPYRG